ncbi:hypothetical protein BBF93_14315 [Hyphomonas sp. CACIAM 19H1]|uniref:N,N-dimethylformamidase beta subunit family domain-containing protein n=1 Tax=Hyphomonas sp. CACIAM 19H1 TaxID=1873716 RepID=UPI000DED7A76|nr:N,N-dimethylformamidase beta subunit family domain-containing protein [Hyphomonas sp. CACIAM 19H1]AXE66461.1 hypothetical protein BBF93_14315 [Hyphomonas sp. CACIAM 19H1]
MIECYCDRPSYRSGDAVDVHVSTSSPRFDVEVLDVTREGRVLWAGKELPGIAHPAPDDVASRGCEWPVSFTVPTTHDWVSAVCLIRLTASDGDQCEGFFVLRPYRPRAALLMVITTSTYQAYNDYGGANAYATGGLAYTGGIPVVSWRRPLPPGYITKSADFVRLASTTPGDESIPFLGWAIESGISIWSGGTGWSNWEHPFVEWVRAEGYELDFACSHDLHDDPGALDGYQLMLSVGHDEYWSWEMRDCVENFIAAGGNVAFFSGNTAFWQVRFDDAFRMTTYKGRWRDDPLLGSDREARVTGLWSNPITGRPENHMTGLSFVAGGYARIAGASPAGQGGYAIYRPEHWIFTGTGLRYGDLLGRESVLIGYEVDGCRFRFANGRPEPTGEDGTPSSFQILGLASAALLSKESAPDFYPDGAMSDLEIVTDQMTGSCTAENLARFTYGHATMGIFERGGTVFAAGTTEWACGLASRDPQIMQITRNLLDRLGKRDAHRVNAGSIPID